MRGPIFARALFAALILAVLGSATTALAGLSSHGGGASASGGLPAYMPASSNGLAASVVIKASAGTFRHIEVLNTSASTLYLQVFNATGLPANGAVPVHVQAVPAGGNGSIDGDENFSTGIVAALSTTPATLTVDVNNDGFFEGGAN
jgi:hypothetical protein